MGRIKNQPRINTKKDIQGKSHTIGSKPPSRGRPMREFPRQPAPGDGG
jgi:hypothetical protein